MNIELRLKELFAQALEQKTPAAREKFLVEASKDQPELRSQVESLLDAHEQAGDFLRQTILLPAADFEPEPIGSVIGRYKLLEKIGEGGFGVVYMAEQQEPVQRKVALKIIKAGMDTREVIARFEAERQALALMDHPNIAKVLDAGATEAKRPYFVMELVRGVSITDYCDQANLATSERLQLFIKVCQAVQHAHQKAVIHRDLKPSNILVTLHDGEPVPKVIDFGVAKALGQKLTNKTLFTSFRQMIGTPAYMAPEQAEMSGLDVDTRSDIYSLGVLLYELLTGVTPFDKEKLARAALDEIRRMIRETEPPKPSTRLRTLGDKLPDVARHRRAEPAALTRLVHGDLDWIVMKCLEKDRTRRYEAVNSLASDLNHFLQDEPVSAAAPSALYRTQKFVRRHKPLLAGAAAFTALLCVGALVSGLQAVRATRAERAQRQLRQHAQASETQTKIQARKSEQVAKFLQEMLQGVGPAVALGRDTKLLREILEKTSMRLSLELTNQPEVEAELRNTIGEVYCDLGDYRKAEEMHRRALEIQQKLLGNEHPEVAHSLIELATVLQKQGRLAEAEALVRQALAMSRKLSRNADPLVARSLLILGSVLGDEGKLGEAETIHQLGLTLSRELYGNKHSEVADSLDHLANVLFLQGRLPEAESFHREGLAVKQDLLGVEHPTVAASLNNLANVLRLEDKLAEAEDMQRRALQIQRKLLGPDHLDIATSLNNLANFLQDQNKLSEAESLQREAVEMLRKLLGDEAPAVAASLNNLAQIFDAEGKLPEAETMHREALAMQRKLLGNDHPEVANSINNLAYVLRHEGKLNEAEALFREGVAEFRKLAANDPAQEIPYLGMLLHHSADLLRERGILPEARALAEEADAMYQRHPDWPPLESQHALLVLGDVLRDLGDFEGMENLHRIRVDRLRAKVAGDDPQLADALAVLAFTLLAHGKFAQAEPAARECLAIRQKQRPDDWSTFNTSSILGATLLGQKKYSDAEPLLLAGYRGIEQREDTIPMQVRTTRLKEAGDRLVQLYQAVGKPEQAAEWSRKLADVQP